MANGFLSKLPADSCRTFASKHLTAGRMQARADFRAPLGRAVIGGVITSTLLTLLVIPTFYEILDQMREWLTERAGRLFGKRHAAEPAVVPGAAGGGVD